MLIGFVPACYRTNPLRIRWYWKGIRFPLSLIFIRNIAKLCCNLQLPSANIQVRVCELLNASILASSKKKNRALTQSWWRQLWPHHKSAYLMTNEWFLCSLHAPCVRFSFLVHFCNNDVKIPNCLFEIRNDLKVFFHIVNIRACIFERPLRCRRDCASSLSGRTKL